MGKQDEQAVVQIITRREDRLLGEPVLRAMLLRSPEAGESYTANFAELGERAAEMERAGWAWRRRIRWGARCFSTQTIGVSHYKPEGGAGAPRPARAAPAGSPTGSTGGL